MSVIAARIAGVALCLVIAGLAGCDQPPAVTATVQVEFEESSEADRTRATDILRARFEGILDPETSSIEVKPGDGAIVDFVIRGGSIPEDEIKYYAYTQGILSMAPLESPRTLLVSDQDVQSIQVSGDGTILDFAVSEAAGKRLHEYTSQNSGKVIVTTLDDRSEKHSTIEGEMSRYFAMTDIAPEQAVRTRNVMKHGRLPVTVAEVDFIYPVEEVQAECKWACPEEGRKYRDALAAAIARAERIVVTEHSSPYDAFDEKSGHSLASQEISYGTVTLSAEQREQFHTLVAGLRAKTQDWVTGCAPAWHHTVRFYENDQLASTMKICFVCAQVSWDGDPKNMHPRSIHRGLNKFVTSIGLQPKREWGALVRERLASR